MNLINNKYKDKDPEATVNYARGILNDLNIKTTEKWHDNAPPPMYSLSLGLEGTTYRVYGKGINKQYALASAYGELFERMQNVFPINSQLLNNPKFNNKKLKMSDEEPFNLEYFQKNCPKPLSNCFCNNDGYALLKSIPNLKQLPYFHVNSEKVVALPISLFQLGTNGMCAGNTNEEAIVQGLCEIFEREVLKQIYFNSNVTLPVLSDNLMQNLAIWPTIYKLRNEGYNVSVRDCTLGRQFPVMGIFIKKGTFFKFNLGAAPDYKLAIERCFTEFFQSCNFGFTTQNMNASSTKTTPIGDDKLEKNFWQKEYWRSIKGYDGLLKDQVLNCDTIASETNLFAMQNVSNKQILSHFLQMLINRGYQIYLRDNSFLGFPAFHIYIPGLSEPEEISLPKLEFIYIQIPKAQEIIYNFDRATLDDFQFLITVIEKLFIKPAITRKMILKILAGNYPDQDAAVENFAIEIFITLLFCYSNQYHKAYEQLHEYLSSQQSDFDYSSGTCLLAIIEQFKNGHTKSEVLKLLADKYDQDMLTMILDLATSSKVLANFLAIPKCQECRSFDCSYSAQCQTEKIENIASKIQNAIYKHQFKQTTLLKL